MIMRVKPLLVPVLFIVALLGTVFIAQAAGAWSTSGRTTVNAEQLKPADVKGWMTLQQVSDGIGISQPELYALISISPDIPAATALKDLESIAPGFELTVLRDKLTARAAALAGQAPAAQVHATPTPLPAGTILAGSAVKGSMTLRDISTQCAVPLDSLLQALKLPADANPATAIKDLVAQGKLSEVTTVQQAVSTLQSK
jgi:hypothetical protein